VPESRRRDELELELQTALGMPLIATKGYGALETGAAYARALDLGTRLGCSEQQLIPILYGQWANAVARLWTLSIPGKNGNALGTYQHKKDIPLACRYVRRL
jgi:hypothetical protein